MIIDCVSDMHGEHPQMPGGDVLVVAGDITGCDYELQWARFFEWFARQQYKHKLMIAGNHDGILVANDPRVIAKEICGMGADDFIYLQDSGCEIEGVKFWGAPWTPPFFNWYFMLKPEQIAEKWRLIPDDTNVLITHGPPYGTLDSVSPNRTFRCGCESLALELKRLKQLKAHIFGHIHGGYGKIEKDGMVFVNAAHMDEEYEPINKPIRIEL